jgi:uncharacterized repeat protein (TIGR03803 family)
VRPNLVLTTVVCLASVAWAGISGSEYRFKSGLRDGADPRSSLVTDGAGNFYGTTLGGGSETCRSNPNCGTVFWIGQGPDGRYEEAVIHTFTGAPDGFYPSGNLILDSSGNLFGTTQYGGTLGFGTVFKLAPQNDGSWTETILYSFQGGTNGYAPMYGVTFDTHGDLYGTTFGGGTCGGDFCGGTVFELVPQQDGSWEKTTAYAFAFQGESQTPGSLIFDASGNMYGNTVMGGGAGTIFQLIQNQNGSWVENVLYSFMDGLDGGYPSGVIFDGNGNLYGEALIGGSFACPGSGCGTVFRLTPGSNGQWEFSVIHTFNGLNGSRGQAPAGGLAVDSAENLYGVTEAGGTGNCFGGGYGCGTIFKLTAGSGGEYSFGIIASFDGRHGADPGAGVILDSAGNIYGTASEGGDLSCGAPYGCGTAFMLTP